MYFDLGKRTVAIENRSVALGTCRLAHSLFSVFSLITCERMVRSGMGEALIDVSTTGR